jgi:hypothetical protein
MNPALARHEPNPSPATNLLVCSETAERRARRAERDRKRKRSRRAQSPGAERREAYLALAVQLEFLARTSPDETTRGELNRAIYRIRLRGSKSVEACREAVFTHICKSAVELSRKEIAEDVGLSVEDVQVALDYLTSANVDLVEIHTRGGKENCGRKGTVLYYRPRGHTMS